MILVLGGTTEGRELALELQQNGYPCLLSVVTELGAKMAQGTCSEPRLRLQIGELDSRALTELLHREKIQLILDATHPYATAVKTNALMAANAAGITYARFERKAVVLPDLPQVVVVADYAVAFKALQEDNGGILFTIGINNLTHFKSLWLAGDRLVWVKIYPEEKSLITCKNLGLGPEQIFAFHGPGNKEILKAIIRLTGVSWLVTKESGSIGGINLKIAAVLETGKKLLVIKRPEVNEGLIFQTIAEIKEFVATEFKTIR